MTKMLKIIVLICVLCSFTVYANAQYIYYEHLTDDSPIHAILRYDKKTKIVDYYIVYSQSRSWEGVSVTFFSYVYLKGNIVESYVRSLVENADIFSFKIWDIEIYDDFSYIKNPQKCFSETKEYKLHIIKNKVIEDYNTAYRENSFPFLGNDCAGCLFELFSSLPSQRPLLLKRTSYKKLHLIGPALMFDRNMNADKYNYNVDPEYDINNPWKSYRLFKEKKADRFFRETGL